MLFTWSYFIHFPHNSNQGLEICADNYIIHVGAKSGDAPYFWTYLIARSFWILLTQSVWDTMACLEYCQCSTICESSQMKALNLKQAYPFRLPNPILLPYLSSSKPPDMPCLNVRKTSLSTSWICCLHSLLSMMFRSCNNDILCRSSQYTSWMRHGHSPIWHTVYIQPPKSSLSI